MRPNVYRLPTPTQAEAFTLPVPAWNRLVRFLARNQVKEARELEGSKEGHPWETRVEWDGQGWAATVRPGFVNGREVMAAMGDGTRVGLLARPKIPLARFRPVTEPPPWFRDKWPIRPAAEFQEAFGGGAARVMDVDAEREAQARGGWVTLWESSLYLTIQRPRLLVDPQAGRVLLSVTGGLDAPPIIAATTQTPPPDPDNKGILLGERDGGQDSILVATVFFVSPGNAPASEQPGEGWRPFVKSGLFYNLAGRAQTPKIPAGGLDIGAPFALFGSEIIRRMVEDLERANSELAAAMTAARVRGHYWSV